MRIRIVGTVILLAIVAVFWLADEAHAYDEWSGGCKATVSISPEAQAELDAKVLEIANADDGVIDWLVPPGESMRAMPACLKRLRIRSGGGEARYTVFLVPR